MGFEIQIFYCEKGEDGKYDLTNVKETRKKVGSPYEDVSLQKLANAVLLQRARRDVLVTDIEAWEYQKTKIVLKELKDGISIKSQKFTLTGDAVVEDSAPEVPEPPRHTPRSLAKVPPQQQQQSIKTVILDPEESTIRKIRQLNLKLSVGKDYQVNKIRDGSMFGIYIYTIVDDRGKNIEVSSEYFVDKNIRYFRDDGKDGFGATAEVGPKLLFDGAYMDDVVDIRRK